MVVVAQGRSTRAVFAFLAIIVGSSAMLPAQSRFPSGKPTYKAIGTRVAQAPSWMPAFEPPKASEEQESRWTGPSSVQPGVQPGTATPGAVPMGPSGTSMPSPFATTPPTPMGNSPTFSPFGDGSDTFDAPPLLSADGDQVFDDGGYAPELEGFGDAYGPDGFGAEPAPVFSTGTWFRRGNWFVEPGFLWWTIENPRTVVLATDQAAQALYTTTDSAFRYTPGLKVTVGKFLGRDAGNRDHLWELTFLGVLEWQTEFEIGSPAINGINSNPLNPGGNTTGFSGANHQTYRYDADFNSLELNYRINSRPDRDQMALQPDGSWVRFKNSGAICSVFGGLRGIKIGNTVDYSSESVDDNSPNVITATGDLLVRTNNDMFGPQIGLEQLSTYDEWGWGFRVKLGGFANMIGRRSVLVTDDLDNGQHQVRTERSDEEQLSFLVDCGLFGHYQIRPNLFVRLGYDVSYLTGLALAPENLGLAPEFPVLNSTGDSLYHGGIVSFETVW